jgi:hypothetical protein
MLTELDKDESITAQAAIARTIPFQDQIRKLETKLERLTDLKIDGVLTTSEYLPRKEKLIKQTALLAENIKKSKSAGNRRLVSSYRRPK